MTPSQIIAAVAASHGLTAETILAKIRKPEIDRARREAVRAVNEAFPHLGTPWLGKVFGRDHTTIMGALGRRRGQQPEREPRVNTRRPPGETRFSAAAEREICRLRRDGWSLHNLAWRMGASTTVITRILRRHGVSPSEAERVAG